MAGTLFIEEWDSKLTGFVDYEAWLSAKLNKSIAEISEHDYEFGYQEPFTSGRPFQIELMPGFKEVLAWCRHNEAWTTGNKEQLAWRAQYLNPRVGFDIRAMLDKVNSSLDLFGTNKKSVKITEKLLQAKYNEGYEEIVYTEDKLKNCKIFYEAAINFRKQRPDFKFRIYYMTPETDHKAEPWYQIVHNLFDVQKYEKIINN
jgi:hypothetical protein